MGRLTTHVLDVASGTPAGGLKIVLRRLSDSGSSRCADAITNGDGRCNAPLLADESFKAGRYQLDFHVGDYFRACGVALPDPPFLDVVTVPFGIADPGQHYHVPLLVSPWSYSTYRGS